jgi:hypothetical protein
MICRMSYGQPVGPQRITKGSRAFAALTRNETLQTATIRDSTPGARIEAANYSTQALTRTCAARKRRNHDGLTVAMGIRVPHARHPHDAALMEHIVMIPPRVLLASLALFAMACADQLPTQLQSPTSPAFAKGSGSGGGGGGGGGGTTAPTVLTGPIYLRDSFGFDPLGDGNLVRYDAAGNPVPIFLSKSINQRRAEWPNTSSEVWMTPDAHQTPTWAFAVATPDPATIEPQGSYDQPSENGVLASDIAPSNPTNYDALLPFVQPDGPITVAASAIAGWYTTAVGFTSSGALTSNFENSAAAWIVLRMPRSTPGGLGATATWELHTNGLRGASDSGTVVLQNYNRIAVSYDPATGMVVGSVDGVPTAAIPFTVTGAKYVGFQGNGIVNDFLVEAKAIAP